MENRNGLVIDFNVSTATGTAERDAAVDQVDEAKQRGFRPETVGGDKNYDTKQFVVNMPHVRSHRMWRRTPAGDEVPLIVEPHAMPGMA